MLAMKCAAIAEVVLIIIGGVVPGASDYLPLGQSGIAQLGILFGTAFAFSDGSDVAQQLIRKLRTLREGEK